MIGFEPLKVAVFIDGYCRSKAREPKVGLAVGILWWVRVPRRQFRKRIGRCEDRRTVEMETEHEPGRFRAESGTLIAPCVFSHFFIAFDSLAAPRSPASETGSLILTIGSRGVRLEPHTSKVPKYSNSGLDTALCFNCIFGCYRENSHRKIIDMIRYDRKLDVYQCGRTWLTSLCVS